MTVTYNFRKLDNKRIDSIEIKNETLRIVAATGAPVIGYFKELDH